MPERLPDPAIHDRFISIHTGQVVRIVKREGVADVTGTTVLVAVDYEYLDGDGMVAVGVSIEYLRANWLPWTEPPLDDPDLLEVWLDD